MTITVTELVAWWGAVVATLVLVWDVYKWGRSGPVVNVSASPNMQTIGMGPDYEGKTFATVEATNTGNRATTLTHLIGVQYPSLLARVRRKPYHQFFVTDPGMGYKLPHVLSPGERWLGAMEQNDELQKLSTEGYLYVGVHHSSGRRPVSCRLVIRDPAPEQPT
jgi:hypothetical protein